MQKSSSFSLITALYWTSLFILNAGAISQSEKQKIKCYDEHHWSLMFVRVLHCGKSCPYSRSSRTSGTNSQRPLYSLTSKYVDRGMTRVTPEVSNNCPFAWQCVKLPRSGNMLYIWGKCLVGAQWVDSERKLADRSKRYTKALYKPGQWSPSISFDFLLRLPWSLFSQQTTDCFNWAGNKGILVMSALCETPL